MNITSVIRTNSNKINHYRHKTWAGECDEKLWNNVLLYHLIRVSKVFWTSPIARYKCLTHLFGSCPQCSQQDKCMCTHWPHQCRFPHSDMDLGYTHWCLKCYFILCIALIDTSKNNFTFGNIFLWDVCTVETMVRFGAIEW